MSGHIDPITKKKVHDSETRARIAAAREHYLTRASRRTKGQSRSDVTVYDQDGMRRPGSFTLQLRRVKG